MSIRKLKEYLGINPNDNLSLQDKLKENVYQEKYGCYIAGPWFNKEQEKNNNEIIKTVESYGINCFKPRYDAGEATDGPLTLEKAIDLFNADLEGLKKAHCIIADITDYGKGRDVGTAIEIGYMAALNKPIIIIDFSKNKKSNVMIAGVAKAYIRTTEELIDWFEGNDVMHIDDEELE